MKGQAKRVLDQLASIYMQLWARLFNESRPQFHYALWVFFQAVPLIALFWLSSIVLRLFGLESRLGPEAIVLLLGSLALGAVAAGHVRLLPAAERVFRWLIPCVFGGVAATWFWLITAWRWNAPTVQNGAIAFAAGACLFTLLGWLFRLEAAAKAKENVRSS
jgi:hypothetical protein